MRPRLLRALVVLPLLLGPAARAEDGDESGKQSPAARVAFFEKDVLPLLKANCYKCHGGGKPRGGLRLTSREAILKGGDTGPAVSLDKPDESLLLKAVHYRDGLEMPPTGKLPAKDIDTLTRWVRAGLPWTPGGGVAATPAHQEKGGKVTAEARNYWAYKPVRSPAVPGVKDRAWVSNPVDAFLLARLEAKG